MKIFSSFMREFRKKFVFLQWVRNKVTIALYRYQAYRCNRYHAITAIGTACIAASGTKISVLLFNLQR